ncbi:unnamed protein product, partial [Chrysoparadoxa australica]
VKLSLELEDATQAGDLLQEALDREARRTQRLAEDVGGPYGQQLDDMKEAHQTRLGQQLEKIDELVRKKKGLSEEAKALLDAVHVEKSRIAKSIQEVRDEAEAELQTARSIWAEGEAMRREKWLSKKMREVRELTMKGLEPEVERIVEKHKADLASMEQSSHDALQRLRHQISRQQDEEVLQAKAQLEEQASEKSRQDREVQMQRRQDMLNEQAKQMQRLRAKLSHELEEQRAWQSDEIKRLDKVSEVEVHSLRAEAQDRLEELKRRHSNEKEAMTQRQASELANTEKEAEREQEAWEARVEAGMGEDGGGVMVEREQERYQKQRDRKLEEAQRRLQLEGEKTARRLEEELNLEAGRMRESHARELNMLRTKRAEWCSKQGTCGVSMGEVLERKRALSVQLRELEAKLKHLQARGTAALALQEKTEAGNREREERALAEHNELAREQRRRRDGLEERVKKASEVLRKLRQGSEEAKAELDAEHEARLEALQLDVTAKVQGLDAKISQAREEVAKELVKAEHAKKMLTKYSKRTGASTSQS